MKKHLLSVVLLICALAGMFASPSAQAWQFETGFGKSYAKDQGDGTWYQLGVPHSKKTITPGYLIGLTGDVSTNLRWHASYVYFGEYTASCLCVTDEQYNNHSHKASVPGYIPFNGHGHTQGLALTLDYGYTWSGIRFGVEAGPWLHWETWHVTHDDPAQPGAYSLDHITHPVLGGVIGLRVDTGDIGISYRLYSGSRAGNPYPGFVQYTHMIMLTKRF